jgi:hypothetical protein
VETTETFSWEKLESALAAWYKQAFQNNAWHAPQGEGLAHRCLFGNSQLFGFQWMD